MKNGKLPTRKQKMAIAAAKLIPTNWLVFKVEPNRLHVTHRASKKQRIIPA